jgi:hypothetical protein
MLAISSAVSRSGTVHSTISGVLRIMPIYPNDEG